MQLKFYIFNAVSGVKCCLKCDHYLSVSNIEVCLNVHPKVHLVLIGKLEWPILYKVLNSYLISNVLKW